MNEGNSSRCVTEYYITPSLHTHGARHSHTRGGPPAHSCAQRRGEGPGRSPWAGWRGAGVPTLRLCAPPREEAQPSFRDVRATRGACRCHVPTPGSAALHVEGTRLPRAFTHSNL